MTRAWPNLRTYATMFALVQFAARSAAGPPRIVERPPDRDESPRIVSREGWSAREPKKRQQTLARLPAPYVVIHHGGIDRYCYTEIDCARIVRDYQDLHMDARGWNDIGYNFVIGEDGNVYEGRGWGHVGAHAPGYNTQSIGICIIGDFTHFIPNSLALAALSSLIAQGVHSGDISNDYRVIGHRQARDTMCPGEKFYEWVMKMSRWTDRPLPIRALTVSSVTYSELSTTEILPSNNVAVH